MQFSYSWQDSYPLDSQLPFSGWQWKASEHKFKTEKFVAQHQDHSVNTGSCLFCSKSVHISLKLETAHEISSQLGTPEHRHVAFMKVWDLMSSLVWSQTTTKMLFK